MRRAFLPIWFPAIKKKEFFASIANGNVLIPKEEKLELAQVFFLIVSGSTKKSQDDSAVTEQGKAGAQRKVQQQVLSVYKIMIFS